MIDFACLKQCKVFLSFTLRFPGPIECQFTCVPGIDSGNSYAVIMCHFFCFILDSFLSPIAQLKSKFLGSIKPFWHFHMIQKLENNHITMMRSEEHTSELQSRG